MLSIRITTYGTQLRQLAALLMMVWTTPTMAGSTISELASGPWSTASHLGFAVNDHSTTGFALTGGTMAMLDITRPIAPDVAIGLRTVASGAKGENQEFYRLGAGPMVTWQINRDWSLHGTVGHFQETGLNSRAVRSYRSHGTQTLIGWERTLHLSSRLEIAAGSFLAYHSGSVNRELISSSEAIIDGSSRFKLPTRNLGVSHGAELAIRLSL